MKKTFVFFILLLIVKGTWAQSYHFSQFFSTPLLTNPANTGFTDGNFRLATNMRTQGLGGDPFFTGYLSADFSLMRNSLPPGSKAGVGFYVMNDHSLTSAVQTNSAGLSVAYNVGLDIYGQRSLGLGMQATYNQRRLDYSKLTFESQFGPGGFDPSLPVGETLGAASKHFLDVNVGGIYSVIEDNRAFFAGLSFYNILKHNDNIIPIQYKMPVRYTFQAGMQLPLENNAKVYLSLTSMLQARANEITLGGGYGLPLDEQQRDLLMGGLWYRYGDAVIPYIGYQRTNFQVGFSYDYTVSAAKASQQIRNGYELTLIYKGSDKRELKTTTIPWF